MTYEQAVDWLRTKPEHAEVVRSSYLDEDIGAAAWRFATSEEMAEVSRLLKLVSVPRLVIADVGCGNGIAAYAMAEMGHDVIGIDPDASDKVGLGAFAVLGQQARGEMRPISGSAEEIPLADNSVDRVYTRQAMHHFRDLSAGVRECARVLKRGGLLLGTREHVVSDTAELKIFLRDHIMQSLHGHEHAFKLVEYTDAIKAAGLRLLCVMGRLESVVNYFPGTESKRIDELTRFTRERFGGLAGWMVEKVPLLQRRVGRWLSNYDRYPGRLYSFLAVKT
jgi:SAM-dependent methyltransferase